MVSWKKNLHTFGSQLDTIGLEGAFLTKPLRYQPVVAFISQFEVGCQLLAFGSLGDELCTRLWDQRQKQSSWQDIALCQQFLQDSMIQRCSCALYAIYFVDVLPC